MAVLKLRHRLVRKRVHVNVWAGENPAGLYWAGRLVLKPEDWNALLNGLEDPGPAVLGEESFIPNRPDVIVEEGP